MKRTPFLKTGVYMKKIFIASGIVILIAIVIFAVVKFSEKKSPSDISGAGENITADIDKTETDFNVDGWLKITKIFDYDGRLAVVAENLSDDVEYARLTVKNKNELLSFNISALLHGTKAVLLCNESALFNPDELYTLWQIEDVLYFEKTPEMNNEKFETSVTDGSISVRSVSGEDIASDIFVYYKEKENELLNGSFTHRIRVEGLKAGSQTYVRIPGINEGNCQIIFTEYDDKEV